MNKKIVGKDAYNYIKNNDFLNKDDFFLEESEFDKKLLDKHEEIFISVLIATYNRRKILEKNLSYLKKQNYKNYEIIIVNDCSKDDTKDFLSKIDDGKSIRTYNNERNLGIALNKKKGLSLAKGDYVIFLDDDDYIIDFDFFKKANYIFNEHENLSIVGSSYILNLVNEKKIIANDCSTNKVVKGIDFINGIYRKFKKSDISSTIFSKRKLEEYGIDQMYVNDSTIFLSAMVVGDVYNMKDFGGVYNLSNISVSKNLKSEFMIENIDQDLKIYQKAEDKGFVIDDKLREDTIRNSTMYYMNSSKTKFSEIAKILKRYERYLSSKTKFKLFSYYLKIRIKNIALVRYIYERIR